MEITWFGWLYLVLAVLGVCLRVAMIGKRRNPIEPGEAIVGMITTGLLMWGLFTVGVTK